MRVGGPVFQGSDSTVTRVITLENLQFLQGASELARLQHDRDIGGCFRLG